MCSKNAKWSEMCLVVPVIAAIYVGSHLGVGPNGRVLLASDSENQMILDDLEEQWLEATRSLPDSGDDKLNYGVEANLLVELIEQRYQTAAKWNALISAVSTADKSGFALLALRGAILVLVQHGSRDSLVDLLSKTCPDRVGPALSIEGYLIVFQDRLADGTLIVCDAYSQSSDDTTRKTLVTALRRGFGEISNAVEQDSEFVDTVRQWYIKHKHDVEPNRKYEIGRSGKRRIPVEVLIRKM